MVQAENVDTGYEISNWIIVLGAIIIVSLIFRNSH